MILEEAPEDVADDEGDEAAAAEPSPRPEPSSSTDTKKEKSLPRVP